MSLTIPFARVFGFQSSMWRTSTQGRKKSVSPTLKSPSFLAFPAVESEKAGMGKLHTHPHTPHMIVPRPRTPPLPSSRNHLKRDFRSASGRSPRRRVPLRRPSWWNYWCAKNNRTSSRVGCWKNKQARGGGKESNPCLAVPLMQPHPPSEAHGVSDTCARNRAPRDRGGASEGEKSMRMM